MNTKQDYINLKDTEKGQKALRDLLDLRYIWKSVRVLETKEQGLEDSTHRIIDNDGDLIQQEYVEDDNAKIFRLGFTVQEVEELIGE